MDWTLFLPGLIISLMLFILLNRRFKLIKMPLIKPKKPHVDVQKIDNFIGKVCFIGFFYMFGVGLWWINHSLSFIICGIAGVWFCFPRGEER
jgi:hypothetical protein